MSKTHLTVLQKSYLKRVDSLLKTNPSFKSLMYDVKKSVGNTLSQRSREEAKIYDERWINELEVGFAALDRIIANPRRFIKDNPTVVLAGMAKRVNAESVRHLAAHTEYIRSVDAKGNVTPERILSILSEDDVQIYENRFIMTLIKKLIIFIEKRYNFIRDHGETRNSDVLVIHSSSQIDDVTYECDNRIKVSKPSSDYGMAKKNQDLLEKIVRLRERANFYLHSTFMQEMEGAKLVHSPVSMTNMLLKQPDYHKAYKLWKFIDAYTKLGVTYKVKEVNQTFSPQYVDEIYSLVLADMLTLYSHQIAETIVDSSKKMRVKEFTPRILLSLEDETFLNGKFAYHPFAYEKLVSGEGGEASEGKKIEGESSLEEQKKKEEALRKAEEKRAQELAAKAEEIKQKQIEAEEKARLLKEKKEQERQARLAQKAAEEAARKEQERLRKEAERQARLAELERQKEAELLRLARENVKKEALDDKAKDSALLREIERKEALIRKEQEKEAAKQRALAEKEAAKKAAEEARLRQIEEKKAAAEAKKKAEEEAKAKALEEKRLAEEKAEQERLAAEKAEQDRLAAEKAEQERLAAEKAEQDRLAAEAAALAAKKAEEERLAAEKAEQDRLAAEKAEQERLAQEQAEQERLAKEKAEQERLMKEKAEQDRLAAEAARKAEAERLAREKAAQEEAAKKAEEERAEQERLAREKAEQDRLAAEQAEQAKKAAAEAERQKRLAEKPVPVFAAKKNVTKNLALNKDKIFLVKHDEEGAQKKYAIAPVKGIKAPTPKKSGLYFNAKSSQNGPQKKSIGVLPVDSKKQKAPQSPAIGLKKGPGKK